MNCENFLCIYQLEGKCVVEKISINGFGMCAECIYPDMDDEILQQAKLKLLRKYEEQDNCTNQ